VRSSTARDRRSVVAFEMETFASHGKNTLSQDFESNIAPRAHSPPLFDFSLLDIFMRSSTFRGMISDSKSRDRSLSIARLFENFLPRLTLSFSLLSSLSQLRNPNLYTEWPRKPRRLPGNASYAGKCASIDARIA
jgi:hypothetical protein